jgi:hypothetical protein
MTMHSTTALIARRRRVVVGWVVLTLCSLYRKIKDQRSRIKDQRSKIKDQESRIKNQESRIKNQESRIKNQESKIKRSHHRREVVRSKIIAPNHRVAASRLEGACPDMVCGEDEVASTHWRGTPFPRRRYGPISRRRWTFRSDSPALLIRRRRNRPSDSTTAIPARRVNDYTKYGEGNSTENMQLQETYTVRLS